MKVVSDTWQGDNRRQFEVDEHLVLKGDLLLPALRLTRRLQALFPVLGEPLGRNGYYPLEIGYLTDNSFLIRGDMAHDLRVQHIRRCVESDPSLVVSEPSRVGDDRTAKFYANQPFTRWDVANIGKIERVGNVRYLDPGFYRRKAIEVFVEPASGHNADLDVISAIGSYMRRVA